MRIYISGPITKDKAFYNKFLDAEKKLKDAGYEVVNPAKLGVLLPKTFTHADYMDIDLMLLRKCEAIYMLKNWKNSIGAVYERMLAKELGMTIYYEVGKGGPI